MKYTHVARRTCGPSWPAIVRRSTSGTTRTLRPTRTGNVCSRSRALPSSHSSTRRAAHSSRAHAWTLDFLFFGFVNCPDSARRRSLLSRAPARRLADLPAVERPEVVFVSVDPGLTARVASRAMLRTSIRHSRRDGNASAIADLTDRSASPSSSVRPRGRQLLVDHTAAIFLVDPEARVPALFGTPH